MKTISRQIGRPHDLYIDRFAASLYVYGREPEECERMEHILKNNALYIWVEVDPLLALKRVSQDKIDAFKITPEVQMKTRELFMEYFEKHSVIPVLTVNGDTPVDVPELLRRIDEFNEVGMYRRHR
jgi:thymidylate kinase